MKDLMLQALKYALEDYRRETKLYTSAWRNFFVRCRDIARYGHTNSQEALKKLRSAVEWYVDKLNNAESAMQVLESRQQFISIVDDMCKKKVNRTIRI